MMSRIRYIFAHEGLGTAHHPTRSQALRSMMKSQNPTDVAKRQYKIRFAIAMIAYIAIIFPLVSAADHAHGAWKIALALTPLIPLIAVFVSAIQMIRGIDELERQIHIEALAVAAGVTALLSVTYGFLEVAHFPRPSAWFTYAIVMLAWCIATPFVSRKYKG
jgi:hypothetical protein